MRFDIARRTLCRWMALGAGLALPLRPSPAGAAPVPPAATAATSATLDVGRALKEMAELEGRIEEAQRRESAEQRRLREASRSLESVNSTLARKDRLTREGEQFLQRYGAQLQAGVQSLEERMAADHQTIGASRGAVGEATAALLAGGATPTASTPEMLALGLLQEAHRDRARLASRRILEQEARRAELAGKSEHAAQSMQAQSVFAQYSLQQLRERHQALARQVAETQAQADDQSRQVALLASRRSELKQLMARLAEQEAARAAQPTPAPAATPAAAAAGAATPVAVPVATPRPEWPPKAGQLQPAAATPAPAPMPYAAPAATANPGSPAPAAALGAAEVPYEEGSGPLIGPIRASGDKDQTDPSGTRFLFWRARPVGVCALAGGKVLFSGSFAGYRHLLIIDHGDGWRALYGNLTQCSLKPGDAILAGQALGQYQAVQGTRAEPLWFELRQGVQAVAPESWPALPAQWQGRLLARLS